MIDTHSHLNFEVFSNDWEEVVSRAFSVGVEKMVVVGTNLETSTKAVDMAQSNPALYAAVGIHPHHAKHYRDNGAALVPDMLALETLARRQKVVAVGEIGLDYHVYENSDRYSDVTIDERLIQLQRQLFKAQLGIAQKLEKPVIVHSRKAKREVLELIEQVGENNNQRLSGVFHCFEGGKTFAREIIQAGLHISFTGNVTYEEGKGNVSLEVPLNRLLLETDCPYMIPRPERDQKRPDGDFLRSEPRHVKIIGQFHAKIRGVSEKEVFKQTTDNAQALFGI